MILQSHSQSPPFCQPACLLLDWIAVNIGYDDTTIKLNR